MDLVNCKLISRSRSKFSEKCVEYKYWESSVVEPKSPSKNNENYYSSKLSISRSVPKLKQNLKPKSPKENLSMVDMDSVIMNPISKKEIIKSYIDQISQEKKTFSYFSDIPEYQTNESLGNYARPHKLTPIHKHITVKTAYQGAN